MAERQNEAGSDKPDKWLGPEFKTIPIQSQRKNPQSLRRFIFDFLHYKYNGNLSKASVALNNSAKKRKGRNFQYDFTPNVLYDLANDRIYIKYVHLDAISQDLDVPVSLILIYSRYNANLAEGSIGDLSDVIWQLKSVVDRLQSYAISGEKRLLDFSDIEKWQEQYGPSRLKV